jgi:hypothetical protein
VEADFPYWIQTDGEARGSTQIAEISVQTHALKLLMPPAGMDLLKNTSSRQWN